MEQEGIFDVLAFKIGSISLSASLLTSAFLSFLLILISWLASKRLRSDPGPWQTIAESLYLAAYEAVSSLVSKQVDQILAFVSGLWLFVFMANMIGLVPGFSSPTADVSVTMALAVLVYFSVHWFGIRSDGLMPYLKHYLKPNPLLLPLHLISELSRTLALAIRLFGNVMSLEMAAYLILLVAGLLVPIPLLMLHIIEAMIQAYLFGMLALIYIAGGIQSHETRKQEESLT